MGIRRLRVPQQGYRGFAALMKLSAEQFEELFAALQFPFAPVREREFVEHVVSSLHLTSKQQATDTIELVLTLYVVRTDAGYASLEDLITSLRLALEPVSSDELPKGIDWEEFGRRLKLLLALDDTVGTIAKATYLVGEHEHVLHNSELFTDIRPVFRSDPHHDPVGAILTHHLKLTYHEAGELKVLFLALSSEGLTALRSVLDRGEQKAQTLRTFLDARTLPVLGEEK